ncbi:peptidase [Streptomyces roseoverticillatus]|uniref:leishmanolysin-related zinc metalloendopeptidase n=1 Tax=Streptomyces roseoverticillatus TaxID=66429 RepID=UPI001F2CFD0F|nr:leishmanolysin-related zinc metalloendopeptidase [Streptomyces roseoverticillatus]MCF3106298.1 peptidase [Streptomyces roseoverticillatus]
MTGQSQYAFETYRAVADADRAAELAATTSPFQIEVRFLGGLTESQKTVFSKAADRWTHVIVGDLETATINDLTGKVVIDDLLIDAEGVPIDGINHPHNILGEAGPTRFRRSDAASGAGLPVKGHMRFDSADLAQMEEEDMLLDVITHEMGHVLAIGTLWDQFGLLKDFPGPNPTFVGPGAMDEFGKLIGEGPTPVPVANVGGAGSAGGHWRESVFANELMSPVIGGRPGTPLNDNPMSRVTVASLGDLGYTVDLEAAQDFELPDHLAIASSDHVPSAAPEYVVLPTIPTRIPAERP